MRYTTSTHTTGTVRFFLSLSFFFFFFLLREEKKLKRSRKKKRKKKGTEDVFWKDDSVLYISSHQQDTFPGTGKINSLGAEEGEGFTINLPLPASSGDAALTRAFEEVVLPALTRFQPDLLIVSAGYDSHWRDPLAAMNALTRTYHYLSAKLAEAADEMCRGRIVFLLEVSFSSSSSSFAFLFSCPPPRIDVAFRRGFKEGCRGSCSSFPFCPSLAFSRGLGQKRIRN